MKDDNFTIFSSILLGILQVLTFFGFVLMAFVAEPIAHSVRERCPECLVEFAGYYGQCIVFFVFTFTNLLSPCILHYIAYFCGASAYSAMQATSQTFTRNTSIIWMIGGTNNFISALFMILSSNLSTTKNDSVTTTPASRKATYRDFSESEIRILTLFMIGITFLAVILAFLLPNRKIKDSLYEKTEHVDSIKAQLVKLHS
ncbi:unnamed protein product, partial [Mesorhabditis belari]|uniref:Uncharacterized protein n=1 Tax=Mesorhabditis belari TaxID=2138241 RepID=A0AAF3JAP8_9BILA